jgi:hypothetical protein
VPGLALRRTRQIIEAQSNQVKYNHRERARNPPRGSIYRWALAGTAYERGLEWLGGYIFGFRAIIEASQNVTVVEALDSLDVREIRGSDLSTFIRFEWPRGIRYQR